jgi:GNAT superfamily N-acetyltransferase
MPKPPHAIVRLLAPVSDADLRSLAELLVDAVESGAAVSFILPLTIEQSEAWWRKTIASTQPASGREAIVLIARDSSGTIIGSVQLQPAWAPNQPHRADVAKLLVHRRARRTGLGTHLMHAIEQAARDAGFRLLTLDAKLGGVADSLYRRLGWTLVGTIPRFALDPDGKALHDDVIFYKELSAGPNL